MSMIISDIIIYNKYFEIYKKCYEQNKIIYVLTEGIGESNEKIF